MSVYSVSVFCCSRRRRLTRICTSRSGSVISPTINGRLAVLERRRRIDQRHQRHVGRAHAAIGEIDAGRRLGGARRADQDDVGILQIVRRLSVVVRQGVVHGVDAVEIAFVELMLAARPLLALGMEVHGQHAHRLVEHADAGQLQAPAVIAHQVAQLGIDQRVEHGAAVALDRLHDLVHLALGAHQRPDMLLHEHALVLHKAGARHARYRLAGRVGHEMDVEVSVGHGLFYPTATRGETRDCARARRGQPDRSAGQRRFRTRTRPGPSISRPLRTGWEEYPANRESGGESPSNRHWPIHSGLGTPDQ